MVSKGVLILLLVLLIGSVSADPPTNQTLQDQIDNLTSIMAEIQGSLNETEENLDDLGSDVEDLLGEVSDINDWKDTADSWITSINDWQTSLTSTIIDIQTAISLLQSCCEESEGAGTWDNYKKYLRSSTRRKMVCGYAEENRLEYIDELGYECELEYRILRTGRERVYCRCVKSDSFDNNQLGSGSL